MAGNRTGGGVVIRGLGQPGDLGWVVMAHGEVYAEQFGWDTSFEVLVARIVVDYSADHDAAREAAWIAEVDGRRAGCIFCVAADEMRPGCASCWSILPSAGMAWAGGSSTPVWASRVAPATSGCGCGPTTP